MVDLAPPEETSFPLAEHPRLRPIEIFPIRDRGRRSLVLRDPADPKISPVVVSDGAADVLLLLDGQRTVAELSSALLLRGASITQSQLRSFLSRLDESGFLEGPRAEHRFAQRRAVFLAGPVRQAAHAGGAYPDGLEELPRMLAQAHLDPDGPGTLPARRQTAAPMIRGLIAPHVDLHRGAPTYSWAYKALAEAAPNEPSLGLGKLPTTGVWNFAGNSKPAATARALVPAVA